MKRSTTISLCLAASALSIILPPTVGQADNTAAAIAYCRKTGNFGSANVGSVGSVNDALISAKKKAIMNCDAQGGGGLKDCCKVFISVDDDSVFDFERYEPCISLAKGPNKSHGEGYGANPVKAEGVAVIECGEMGCSAVVVECIDRH